MWTSVYLVELFRNCWMVFKGNPVFSEMVSSSKTSKRFVAISKSRSIFPSSRAVCRRLVSSSNAFKRTS